jgi:hypothetical protein
MGTYTRYSQQQPHKILSGQSESDPIIFAGFEKGQLITPAALEATTKIAFKVSPDGGTTWGDLRNASNTLVEITVDLGASHAYPLPTELAGAERFKIWTEASGSAVSQSADRAFAVVMKS